MHKTSEWHSPMSASRSRSRHDLWHFPTAAWCPHFPTVIVTVMLCVCPLLPHLLSHSVCVCVWKRVRVYAVCKLEIEIYLHFWFVSHHKYARPRKAAAGSRENGKMGNARRASERQQVAFAFWWDFLMNFPQSESQPTPDRPRPLTIPITTTLRRMNTPLATHALKKKKMVNYMLI